LLSVFDFLSKLQEGKIITERNAMIYSLFIF